MVGLNQSEVAGAVRGSALTTMEGVGRAGLRSLLGKLRLGEILDIVRQELKKETLTVSVVEVPAHDVTEYFG